MTTDRIRAKRRGKNFERHLARLYGGKRNPGNHLGAADVDGDWLTIEAKKLARMPLTIIRWLEQAEKGADVRLKASGKDTLPVVIISEKNKWTSNALVVMRKKDFDAWFGDPPDQAGNRGGED